MKKIVLIFFLLVPLCSYGQETKYTLEKILQLAELNSVDLKEIKLQKEYNSESITQYEAESQPKIVFKSSLGYNSLAPNILGGGKERSDLDGIGAQWGFTVVQPIAIRRLMVTNKIVQSQKRVLDLSEMVQRYQVQQAIVSQFAEVITATELIAIHKKSRLHLNRLYEKVKIDKEMDAAIERDLLQVRAQVLENEKLLLDAQNRYDNSIENLQLLTGHVFGKNSTFTYSLPQAKSYNKSLENTTVPYIDIKKEEVKSKDNFARYYDIKRLPQFNFLGSVTSDATYTGKKGKTKKSDIFHKDNINYRAGVEMTWNIYDGKYSSSLSKQSKIDREKEKLALKKLEDEIALSLKKIVKNIEYIEKSKKVWKLEYDVLTALYDQNTKDYKEGFSDYTTLVELEKKIREMEMKKVSLDIQHLLLDTQYNVTLGIDLLERNK